MLLMASTLMMAHNASKKWGIKSGTITTVTEAMGQKIETKCYFDDYGNLQSSKANSFGMEVSTILRDGKSYMVNHSTKQVQEMPVQKSVNFLDLTDKIVAKYKIKEAGTESVSGKDCVKYTMEVSNMGQTSKLTVSVWNGIPMKTVASAGGVDVTATVTEVTEEEVDASVFEIPSF